MNATAFMTVAGQRRVDTNLLKMGHNRRTKFFHRVRYNGGFYTAFCETGTRITHFEDLDDIKHSKEPCKKCFPKGVPTRQWEWQGPWVMVNINPEQPKIGQWYVCRRRTGKTSAQFGPFNEEVAEELLLFLTHPEDE